MPPTIAQDVASIIATRAEGFLEQYEGSGVINPTPAQKQALVSSCKGGRTVLLFKARKFLCTQIRNGAAVLKTSANDGSQSQRTKNNTN